MDAALILVVLLRGRSRRLHRVVPRLMRGLVRGLVWRLLAFGWLLAFDLIGLIVMRDLGQLRLRRALFGRQVRPRTIGRWRRIGRKRLSGRRFFGRGAVRLDLFLRFGGLGRARRALDERSVDELDRFDLHVVHAAGFR